MRIIRTTILAFLLASSYATLAPGETLDARQAIASATAAADKAAALKNQWTTTTKELKAARAAASSGDEAKAVELAQQAEALAKASIAQSTAEETAWKNAVIK